jgi:hypothetical protein
MRPPSFHFRGGEIPDGIIEVEFVPFSMAELARSDKDVRAILSAAMVTGPFEKASIARSSSPTFLGSRIAA